MHALVPGWQILLALPQKDSKTLDRIMLLRNGLRTPAILSASALKYCLVEYLGKIDLNENQTRKTFSNVLKYKFLFPEICGLYRFIIWFILIRNLIYFNYNRYLSTKAG